MKKILLILAGLFCYQHLMRDYLQDRGVKDWYTTVGHGEFKFIPDTRLNNRIGIAVFFIVGSASFYLAFRRHNREA